ncbi:hypothetical protein [Bacillus sp. AK031]
MGELNYIKLNTILLLAIIPLFAVGYFFAVSNESMFFLYEWLLTLLISSSIIVSLVSIFKIKSGLKWISASILAFLVQFSAMSLFLGPFTEYWGFTLFYIAAFCALVVFIVTLKKADKFKFIPVLFMVLTLFFTLYMILLNNLWGKDLS